MSKRATRRIRRLGGSQHSEARFLSAASGDAAASNAARRGVVRGALLVER